MVFPPVSLLMSVKWVMFRLILCGRRVKGEAKSPFYVITQSLLEPGVLGFARLANTKKHWLC